LACFFIFGRKYFLIYIFMTGKVKWFDSKKGYGFITGENGKEIFVQLSKLFGMFFHLWQKIFIFVLKIVFNVDAI